MSTNAWISPESSPSEGGEAAEGYHRSYVVAPGFITRLRRPVPCHDALTVGLDHNTDLDLEMDIPDTTATPPMAALDNINRICDEEQSPSGRRGNGVSAASDGGSRRRSSSVVKGIVRGYEKSGDAAERMTTMWLESRCAVCFSANCANSGRSSVQIVTGFHVPMNIYLHIYLHICLDLPLPLMMSC